jgi:hypothetical protein
MTSSALITLTICAATGAAAQTSRDPAPVLSFGSSAYSQDLKRQAKTPRADNDHKFVFEFGAAVDWEPAERSVHRGATIALEFTPIEHSLELECGITALAANGGIEIPVDVLFKKPWRVSPGFEFMIGAGPQLVHAFGPNHATFWGGEAVLDFMFWPRKNIGWYVEPGYEITLRADTQHHGVGVAAGLLIGR